MTFPKYKKNKNRGWFGPEEIPDGWEDLGQIEPFSVKENSWQSVKITHAICGTVVNIGKENGEVFRFCSRCLTKVSND